MENEYKREQHYAVSKDGVRTHIKQAYESKEDFFCPACNCKMIKKCGPIRSWHFAHDCRSAETELQKNCTYESYLHAYAKMCIKKWFEESNSITMYYKNQHKCSLSKGCKWKLEYDSCTKTEEASYDIKRCLNKLKEEKNITIEDDTFRPDLLWYKESDQKQRIFIEIKVTHECSEKKVNSKERIIEFTVSSEEDVESIISNDIKESDIVKYWNINKVFIDDQVKPLHQLNKFILYDSGKVYPYRNCSCMSYKNSSPSSSFELTMKSDVVSHLGIGRFCVYGLALAYQNGFKVKHCNICSKCKYEASDRVLKCGITNSVIENGSKALECSEYEMNKDYIKKVLKDIRYQYSQIETNLKRQGDQSIIDECKSLMNTEEKINYRYKYSNAKFRSVRLFKNI
ncbi:MAG: competence protein CoiA [Paludibacteraceae bacterium]|nr:competence protein CoiA [Paludibacteraceae bacterium]